MLTLIAPSGISDVALGVLRQAIDLILAIRRRGGDPGPAETSDPSYAGLLAVAGKLFSPIPEALEKPSEREGLLRLLTLAKDMARHGARDRHASYDVQDRPEVELGDLQRRARNVVLALRRATPQKTRPHPLQGVAPEGVRQTRGLDPPRPSRGRGGLGATHRCQLRHRSCSRDPRGPRPPPPGDL